MAGLLVDNSRGCGFKPLAARPLVYPHRVLMTLVTSLEPSLLNVSVIDFKTRKAVECLSKFPAPQLPACELHSSGSSVSLAPAFRRPGPEEAFRAQWLRTRSPPDPGMGGCPFPPPFMLLSVAPGVITLLRSGQANTPLPVGTLKQEKPGDLAKVTYHICQ